MVTVATFKYQPRFEFRTDYTAEHVNVLFSMVERNYPHPFRFICFTDDARGISDRVEVVPLWDKWASINSNRAAATPSCYRRLPLHAANMVQYLGERVVVLDLDAVIVADPTSLWHRPEPVVAWNPGRKIKKQIYNGSMLLFTPGVTTPLYNEFTSLVPARTLKADLVGSDQAWLQMCLGDKLPTWTPADGVVSWRWNCRPYKGALPEGAKIVFFWGRQKPWHDDMQQIDWIKENWK
jgi:hypothetical protein